MSMKLMAATAAALLATASMSHATTITGSYTAYAYTSGNAAYLPTINVGGSFLPSPFSEPLTVGVTTTPTTFLQVAPKSGGASVGTQAGNIKIALTLAGPSGSLVTGVTASAGGNGATFSGGAVNFMAYYDLFYANQTDCITWNATSCVSTNNTTTIGETLTVSFANGAQLAVNLYNWSDWTMAPKISFDLLADATPPAVPEPATLAVFGGALIALGAARRRAVRNSDGL